MFKKICKRILPMFLSALLIFTAMPAVVFAAEKTNEVLDGAILVTDSLGNGSLSDGKVTVTAPGGLTTIKRKTNTITIKNNTSSTIDLTFSYSASNYNSFSINGNSTSNSGEYTYSALGAGNGFTVKIEGKNAFSSNTATLILSNFSYKINETKKDVVFIYDDTLGSLTVDGNAVSANATVGVSLGGASVVATPKSGYTFLGWINAADGTILSTNTVANIVPADGIEQVRAVFATTDGSGTPWFMVGSKTQKSASTGLLGMSKKYYHTVSGTHLYDNLIDAAQASTTISGSNVIVLMNNATLPAGDYTIHAGTTLLIPFDSDNTMFTTEALSSATYTTPTAYRKLKLAAGANINIEGAMSLSAKHRYATGAKPNIGGTPVGPVSFVDMAEGSNITVKNGGCLYAYGYITGSGSVTAQSGATVYEYFQIMDFRGGTQSTDDSMKTNGVFPISQYYVQNIEVPLTLEYGSTEYAYTSIYMSSAEFSSSVAFISSSNAMFNLTSGKVIKRYDGSTDRLRIEANGNMTVSGISMKVGTSDLDSSDYELPVNSNITVTVDGGTITINQDMALFPGSEILIGEDATCVLGSGNNVYVYDEDQWVGCIYSATDAGNANAKLVPVIYAPGRTYNRTEKDLVDAKIQVEGTMDASSGYLYTTTGGANIFSKGNGVAKITAGTETVTHLLQQVGATFVDIPITSAKLKNADGSYTETASATTATTYNFNNVHGKWFAGVHEITNSVVTPPTCTEQGYTTYSCDCGYSYKDSYVAATGHRYNSVVTAPTCTTGGYTTYTCSVCNHSYKSDETVATGHSYGEWTERTAPGCESAGVEYRVCHCGNEETRAIAAKGHSYNSVVTAPTCTESGYTTYNCTNCTHSYTDNIVAATGHTMGDWVETKAATCTENGEKRRYCSACDHYETEVINAIGHSYNSVVTAPTCTTSGYTTHTCANCGDTYNDSEVEATGHTMGDWVETKAATCTESGEKRSDCSVCDHYVTEVINATGHSYKSVVTAPTCTEAGYTTHTCANCNDTYTDSEVEATGHTFGEWEVVTNATHKVEGVKVHSCACGHSEEATIPVIICDMNNDGVVNSFELIHLRKALINSVVLTEQEKILFDMNDDGKINVIDLVALKKVVGNNV